ncbi:hypothetical protein [[Erwinia] mediterraneensis]|nr:hypothetical protein [[Erwinia] mediterraneensis]
MNSCFIEARNIRKRFGALTALNQVNLSIYQERALAENFTIAERIFSDAN